ncbi:hypothetical protein [Klebsiella quasipneumoniae]|uniref:hypothetical protein n=1 Tax=Klebsiella quasipneumoniae TaxID=1463165 RepID=UPI00388E2335
MNQKEKKNGRPRADIAVFAINYNDGYNNYKKGFKEFLNTTMQEFNQLDDADLKK